MSSMHRILLRGKSCALLLVALSALSGCGGSVATNTVSGKATYRGEPLAGGSVTFHPDKGQPTIAAIDSTGSYTVELPLGEYRVAVYAAGVKVPEGWKDGDPSPPPPKLVLPSEYSTRAKTKLHITVTGSGTQTEDFILK